MHIAIARVVPDTLSFELESVKMSSLFIMRMCVSAAVAAAANIAAYQADP
jgi:hypothetical protein